MKKLFNITFNNFYFCIFYIFTSFTFVTALKNVPGINIHGINISAKIALAWGILISINNIYTVFKRKPSSIEWFILLLLFISFILSIFIYPNIHNITIWVVDLVLLTSVFYINKEKTKATLEKELFIISNVYVALTFIFSSISLIIFKKGLIIPNFTVIGKGGFFENENALGIAASISFGITLYLIFSAKSKLAKSLYLVNLLIQFSIIITSDSRSSFFLFISLVGVLIFIKLKKPLLRILFIFIPCLGIIYSLLFKDTILNAVTSNRTNIWGSAALVIKDNFLLGVGDLNLVDKITTARVIYISQGIVTGGLHNIYIQVFASNGLFTFISFISILLISLFKIFNSISILKSEEDIKSYFILSLIVNILIINLFESTILYIISFVSIVFWTYLGYILSIIETKRNCFEMNNY